MAKAIYHPKAKAEALAALADYARIDRENVVRDLAPRFWDAVLGAEWKIESAPHRWAPYMLGTRRLRLPRPWPFALVYLPTSAEDAPFVLACAHDKRRPGYWRDRLLSES